MLASFLKRDLKSLIQKDASPNYQAQNGLLSLRSWWRSVGSLKFLVAITVAVRFSFDISHLTIAAAGVLP